MIERLQITPKADHYELKIRFSASKTSVPLSRYRNEAAELLGVILVSLKANKGVHKGGAHGFWRDGRIEELLVEPNLERRNVRG